MADQKQRNEANEKQPAELREPRGFTPKSGGLTSEYAREQGWDTHEAERMKAPSEKQEYDGGRDYEYGARDFGDTAVDTSSATPEALGVNASRLLQRDQSREDRSRSEQVQAKDESLPDPEMGDL